MNSIQKFSKSLLFILLVILIVPSYILAQGKGWGYVWANNPTASSYTPSLTYSYNSSGKGIKISRKGSGRYTVTFYGLGGNGSAGGNVQVTGYGPGSENCKVENWDSGGKDFIVNVRCFTASGNLVDTRFSLRVDWPTKPILLEEGPQLEGSTRTILQDGTVQISYPDGSKKLLYSGGFTMISANGDTSRASFINVQADIPPSLPSDQKITDWLNSHNDALFSMIQSLLEYDATSVEYYKQNESRISNIVFGKINLRSQYIFRLISQ